MSFMVSHIYKEDSHPVDEITMFGLENCC